MKRLIPLLLLLFAGAVGVSAPIDANRALERIRGAQGSARYTSKSLTLVYSGAETAQPAYYVFAAEGQPGYVIAGGDDLATPVLGYADSGSFDYAALPEQMRGWLDFYAREIEWARQQPRTSAPRYSTGRPDRAAIPAMVCAHWDQDSPFNDKCPRISGVATASGCVATAISQIMRYWQYPDVGKGSNSYTWNSQTLTMDFSKVRFDWADMPYIHTDSWTSTQNEAVATLLQAVGYAMDMNYNVAANGGSGAVTAKATDRLIRFFDYAPSSTHYTRDAFGLYDWEDLVYSSLANGCPVLYHGTGSAGGHAFVVDGYQDDGYFHLNWGWGGSSNGYFLLTALDPPTLGIGGGAGGFNYNQGAAINMRPNFTGSKAEYSISASKGYTMSLSGQTLRLSGIFINQCGQTIPEVAFGVLIKNTKGEIVGGAVGAAPTNLAQGSSYSGYGVYLPTDLADGTYYLNPAFGLPVDNQWELFDMYSMDKYVYVLTVKNGNYTLARLSEEEITATDLSMGPKLYKGSKCNLHAKLSNPNSTEVYKYVYVGWYNTSGTFLGVDNGIMTDIPANSDLTWDIPMDVPSRVRKSSTSTYLLSAPSNYKVALVVANSSSGYTRISDLVNVSVLSGSPSATLSASNFVVSNASSVDAMDIALDFDIKCTSGYFADNLYVVVFTTAGSYIQEQLTPEYYLNENESTHVQYRFPFPAGEANTQYVVSVFYTPSPTSTSLSQLAGALFTVGTTGVETVEGDGKPGLFVDGQTARVVATADISAIEVYDLQGVRRQADVSIDAAQATVAIGELPAGVYLLRVATAAGTHTLRLLKK